MVQRAIAEAYHRLRAAWRVLWAAQAPAPTAAQLRHIERMEAQRAHERIVTLLVHALALRHGHEDVVLAQAALGQQAPYSPAFAPVADGTATIASASVDADARVVDPHAAADSGARPPPHARP